MSDTSLRDVVNITDLIDCRPIGGLQYQVILFCGLIALLDGFDVLAIGVAAPAMADALHLGTKQLGAVFSAALLGLMLGAFGLGPLADRIGRRRVLIGATFGFGIFTLCTANATSLELLLLFRFLAGLGLGGALPSFISLATEFTPQAKRGIVLPLIWTGFPLGGAAVSLLARDLLDTFGWQSIFYVGGLIPLITSLALAMTLPDSISYLVARHANGGKSAESQIRRLVARLYPKDGLTAVAGASFVISEEEAKGKIPLRQLMQHGRAGNTVLLWLSHFTCFSVLVTNVAWTPILLRKNGIPVSESALAVAAFAIGSVFGTPLVGVFMRYFSARLVIPTASATGALFLMLAGYQTSTMTLMVVFQGVAGFFFGASTSALIALAAHLYPTVVRSTGVGWATGFARFGSFVGPLLIGLVVSGGWSIESVFVAIAAPGFVAALFSMLIRESRTSADSKAGAYDFGS